MKNARVFICVLFIICIVSGCTDSNISSNFKSSSSNTSSESSFNGYAFIGEDKYDLYNSNNSLNSKKIYVSGMLNEIKVINGEIYGELKTKQSKKSWSIYFCKEKDVKRNIFHDLLGQDINIFGEYKGIDINSKYPRITTERILVNNLDYLLNDFIIDAEKGKFLTEENKYEAKDVTNGEVYSGIIKIFPDIKLVQVYDIIIGSKTLSVEITTNKGTLLDNTRKFVEVMDRITIECAQKLIKDDYISINFTHKIANDDKENYLRIIYNKENDGYKLSETSSVKGAAYLYPEYAKAFSIALDDLK